MSPRKNVFYTLLVLGLAGAVTAALILLKPKAETAAPPRPVTTIEVVSATASPVRLTVRSQGSVQARTRTRLAAEVGGLVIGLSPNFREGGHFRRDEVLVRIDPADYEAAVAAREAELATARLALAEEKARAEQARIDWERLGQGEPGPLTLRQPQLGQARARLRSAEAALAKARRDLERTSVTAPYDGRVEAKYVDLGQVVGPGPTNPLADIFATAAAEVRLPVSDREAGLLALDAFSDGSDPAPEDLPAVTLTGTLNGQPREWSARITRVEASVDPRTRFLYLVAVVEDGFARERDGGSPPLQPGLFVEAEIAGRTLPGAFVLPRHALRPGNRVYLVGDKPGEADNGRPMAGEFDGFLHARTVTIAQSTPDTVVVTSGLREGDRVATSPIAWFVAGMPVRIQSEP